MKEIFLLLFLGLYLVIALSREESKNGRRLYHIHLQKTEMYGNSTDMQYFYTHLHVGEKEQKVALIVDTGSAYAAFPCKGCSHCGTHLNEYFDVEGSSSSYLFNCRNDNC